MNASRSALFPGTFDPITNGHIDVINRGRLLFDELVLAIGHNPNKVELFSVAERLEMIGEISETQGWDNVRLETYDGLTADYAKSIDAVAILRGLRNVTDLNFEFQLALTNRAVADIETVFIMTGEGHAFTSSTLIKQIASGGDIDRMGKLMPRNVIERMKQKKREHGGHLPWLAVDHMKD